MSTPSSSPDPTTPAPVAPQSGRAAQPDHAATRRREDAAAQRAASVPARSDTGHDVGADRDDDAGTRAPASRSADHVASAGALHKEVLAREKAKFGGMKLGSAFFGWLTAMGTVVLLTALVAAIGAALGFGTETTPDEAAEAAGQNTGGAAIFGAIVIGVVLFVGYYAGGYVAGRMARFSGAKQGLAVWIWAIVIAVIVAIITAIAGSQWDVLTNLGGFPRIPVTPETATVTGILAAVGAAIVTLLAAMLGGIMGMRFHRRVDRVGIDAVTEANPA